MAAVTLKDLLQGWKDGSIIRAQATFAEDMGLVPAPT